jgi:hypothetical protein
MQIAFYVYNENMHLEANACEPTSLLVHQILPVVLASPQCCTWSLYVTAATSRHDILCWENVVSRRLTSGEGTMTRGRKIFMRDET